MGVSTIRVSGWDNGLLVKFRQLVALTIQNVVDRQRHAFLIPEVSFTSTISPRTVLMLPTIPLPHEPSRISFEGVECATW
jgi:hypothetical protein